MVYRTTSEGVYFYHNCHNSLQNYNRADPLAYKCICAACAGHCVARTQRLQRARSARAALVQRLSTSATHVQRMRGACAARVYHACAARVQCA